MTIGPTPPETTDPFRRLNPGDRHAQHAAPPGLGAFSLLLDGMQREQMPRASQQDEESRSELKEGPDRRDGQPRSEAAEPTIYAGPVGQEAREALRTPTERDRPEHNAGTPPHQRNTQRTDHGEQARAQRDPQQAPRAEQPSERAPTQAAREPATRQPVAQESESARDQSGRAAAAAQQATQRTAREAQSDARAGVARLASAGAVQAARAQPVQPAAGVQRTEGRAEARQVAQQRPAQQPQRPDTEKFVQQAQRGLAQALQRKDGEVTIRLHPEALGKLTVQVRVEASSVQARFEASTEAAREMLMSHTPALRAALESRGLEVQRIEITLAPEAKEDAGPRFAMSEDADRHAGSHADHGNRRGSDAGSTSGRSPDDSTDQSAEDRAQHQEHTSAAWRSPGSLLIDTVA
ncbi:MAG: flagellar hook-length control protein FliK [Phycisphaerales bacterium]|nr:flagellar hook-length control protein FliK [Phycisphaerales bacterium]